MDINILRHSCAHIMAEAVKELWPGTKLGIGPAIENGFYYDFDKEGAFSQQDILAIEEKMHEIVKRDEPFIREELDKKSAIKLFEDLKEEYKIELIEKLPDEKVSIYRTGKKFVDLCRGPHIDSAGQARFFKLLSVAGAYWHGIETNPMLQRVYGTCFNSQKELDIYLNNLEEAKKRDHRKLGPSLELFDIFHEDAGAGLVFYEPKGALIRSLIEDYEKKEHLKRGYQIVTTPHIMQSGLWKTSGHYDYYLDNMYTLKIEDKEYVLKPMNCPGHILIYKSKMRSYKDLPIRYFELGTVYRHEKTGVLHGLLRVRGFTQDDAHIFCLPSQVNDEIKRTIDFVFDTMKVFGFNDVSVELSTRPDKFIGSIEDWVLATSSLEQSLKDKRIQYHICEGEGAFYGPKIDIKLKDALGRLWQCATIQCDFALPKRFDLKYVDSDGQEKQPIMLHRVLLGSVERFIGALTEHYAGDFPLWLAPVQVIIIPIAEKHIGYAQEIGKILAENDIRCEVNSENETLCKKIRSSELTKVPYIFVVGDKELESKTISVRKRKSSKQESAKIDDLARLLREQIINKN